MKKFGLHTTFTKIKELRTKRLLIKKNSKIIQSNIKLKGIDGAVYRECSLGFNEKPSLLVKVPKKYRKAFMEHCHDAIMSGHGSYDKTLDRLRRMCYWPGMFSDTTAYCQSCRQCSLASNKAFHSPLTPVLSNGPWETVGIDILELNQSGSYRYVLVIQDYYMVWAIARPLVNQTAESVCDIMEF
ncbi:hypothetical protein RF11_12445 [Thelohanellus kitauei]|uniref:Integrase zinc-binding domain-containing protein n=1 Tax=Thelohanellus kitauei TaxID=669202 RepID=A0A0C2MWR9_THEKT|nr:hypothetical protein RF11_12445 [Thelohanellus kitauei]